jgi:hypothetical protein
MSAVHKVVITLNEKTKVTKDAVQWSLYFDRGTTPTSLDFDHLQTVLQTFLSGVSTGQVTPLSSYLSKGLDNAVGAHTARFYAVPTTRGPLGSPVATRVLSTTALASTTTLPSEVAVCLSYQRAYGTDVEFSGGMRPRARDRGRVFLGPLHTGVLNMDPITFETRVITAFRTDITAAAKQALGAAALAQSWIWVHFSPTEWSWDAVTGAWIDDAFDIQRRRGLLPSIKTVVTV